MAIAFLIWSWYFDGIGGASEQPVRTRREALRFHIWSGAHFPLYLGIVVTGVGVQRIVTAASCYALTSSDTTMLAGAAATVMVAIGATSRNRRHREWRRLPAHVVIAIVTFGTAAVAASSPPVVLVVIVASAYAGQLALSLSAGSRTVLASAGFLSTGVAHV